MAKRKNSGIVIIAVGAFLIGLVAGALIFPLRQNTVPAPPPDINSGSKIMMGVPAVDDRGNGVLGKLTTSVKPGSGQVLVDVKDLITLGDTQRSARRAVEAAAAYAKKDPDNIDVIFGIEVNATSIEGTSAGASMAVSIVMNLNNQAPRADVMMTGTIDETGKIGRVGSVSEKAKAAKAGGAAIFLVPRGQSTDSQTEKTRQCRSIGNTQHCRIVYETEQVSIAEKLNMTVIEVDTLGDAIKYFVG